MRINGIGFWARVALLFLIRSGRSTASLSIMVITAVAALIFLSALAVGVNDAMLRNTIGLFSGHISGHKLAASVVPEDLMVDGVEGVLKRVCLPGVVTRGNLDKPLMMCAVDPRRESAMTALPKKIVAGSYLQSGTAQVLISRPIAEELGIHVGNVLQFRSPALAGFLELTVTGIYQTNIDQLDHGVAFCPLFLLPMRDLTWSAAVFLQRGQDTRDIIAAYRQQWPESYQFDSWEMLMPDLRQLIDLQYISMAIVIFLVFGVVAVGIACSFVIFIIKNIREYGIMKAMGVTTTEMSILIVLKVALMNIIACGVGLLIGLLAVWGIAASGGLDITALTSHNRYFSVSGIIYPRLTVFSLLAPPATALCFSLIAATWPAVLLARKKAAEIIRMI
ncbi:MAG: ABC transporter permease [Deltaproteobacteria bacterium]|nr:ABC transporter permease [Candidatus Anaeroferrophillus wilburensis]MBN2888217.1 ABC transporter permease [Deltaproteobacteria bacterium]